MAGKYFKNRADKFLINGKYLKNKTDKFSINGKYLKILFLIIIINFQ